MGEPACVSCGAAQFSKILNFALLANVEKNDARMLTHALTGELDAMRPLLDAEVSAEQAKDRAYWEPLRREMETFRREERST